MVIRMKWVPKNIKRAILALCALCVISGIAFGQADSIKLKITHLTGDFYVYTTWNKYRGIAFPSNSMYVVTDAGVVLIDTPWDTTQIKPLLDSIRTRHHKEGVICLSTHFHADRTGGLNWLKGRGIATWSSKQTLDLCRERGEEQAEFYFEKDTLFQIGQYRFKTIYPGGGHTKDNIVVWFEQEKVLYGGCFVKSTESEGLGNIADAALDEWGTSIKRVMKACRKPKYVIPGHQSWVSSKGLQHTLKLLRQHKKAF